LSYHLAEVALDESNKPRTRIQILKTGTFFDPRYGEFTFNPGHLLKLKENHEKKVRRIDIALDFSHETEQRAAAWFKNLTIENNGSTLFAEVDWTPVGEKSVAEKEFRYISPDIMPNYKDNETLETFGPVLMGAALTNRPVIKGMQAAIELQEQNSNGGIPMANELQEKFNEMVDKCADLKAKNIRLAEDIDNNKQVLQEVGMTPEQMAAKIKELEALLKAEKEKGQLAEDAKQLAEKTAEFELLLSEEKACPAQKEAFLKGDMTEFMKQAGNVHLSEGGNAETVSVKQTPGQKATGTAEDQVLKLAETKMKEEGNKLDQGEAVSFVLSENPKLRKAYEDGNSVQAVATAQ